MKKVLLAALALMTFGLVNAQTIKDDLAKSAERTEKLQKLCNSYQTCGNANIDGYGNSLKDAAVYAIQNSNQLDSLYYRQIGETKDGIQDVTIKKPTLEEWVSLSSTIAGESTKIKEATDKAKDAGEEAKNIAQSASSEKNPMKAAKAAKTAKAATAVVEFGNEATPVLMEESAAQLKAVEEIIKTLKSGANF